MKLILISVVLLAGCLLWWLRRTQLPRLGQIGTSSELQEKYGLYAENRPIIRIEPANVPEHLRDLIPMAEKWGISDDIMRSDFEAKEGEASKREFQNAIKGRTGEINKWLDSFGAKNMTRDAAAFMYMTLALDETKLWVD